jgi:tryptophan-rich sensory protein
VNEIPVLSDAPAAKRARDEHSPSVGGDAFASFGQVADLEVSRRPPGRMRAVMIATVCVLATNISSLIFVDPDAPRIDPIVEFPWYIRVGPFFATIWVVLLLTLIASFYLILRLRPDNKLRREAIAAYILMLTLNTVWAWLLFAGRVPTAALYASILALLATTLSLWIAAHLSKRAGLLLAPQLSWTLFMCLSTTHIAF